MIEFILDYINNKILQFFIFFTFKTSPLLDIEDGNTYYTEKDLTQNEQIN